jgi:hypothetical protein
MAMGGESTTPLVENFPADRSVAAALSITAPNIVFDRPVLRNSL